jgi:hypothetical protein
VAKVNLAKDLQKQKEPEKPPVKCKCVHGYCLSGETKCHKCDEGWTGLLCDSRIIEEKK